MRHRKDHRKLSRTSAHRWAMLRNLATSVLEHEHVRTTDEKAKEVRRVVERCITLARRARNLEGTKDEKAVEAGRLHLRRHVLMVIRDKDVVAKLFDELATRFAERPGGYTRIVKLGVRRGDGASISMIELLPAEEAAAKKTKKTKTTKKKAAPKAAAKAPAKPKAKKEPAKKAAEKDAE